MDIPDSVLGQLGNRIQHALRAYTPKEQKAVRAAASSFRENPSFDTEEAITDVGVGEALVSLLDAKGVPGVVGRTLIRPPASRLGPVKAAERKAIIADSPFVGVYEEAIDRESAYKILENRTSIDQKKEAKKAKEASRAKTREKSKEKTSRTKKSTTRKRSGRRKKSAGDHLMYEAKLVARQIARQHGRKILRGILGSMTRR